MLIRQPFDGWAGLAGQQFDDGWVGLKAIFFSEYLLPWRQLSP